MSPSATAAPGLHQRLLALVCIAAAVGAGALAFQAGGAPTSYLVVNGLAMLVPAAALLWCNTDRQPAIAPVIAVAAIVLLTASLAFGPGIEGVQRWLPLGPLQIHVGMAVLPALVVALPRLPEAAALTATALCAATFWAQPDFSAALALFIGIAAATTGLPRSRPVHGLRLITAIGLVLTAFRPDPLEAVRFVETALSDAWALSPVLGGFSALALVLAVLLPARLAEPRFTGISASARGLTGAMAGFAIAGLVAPFPQPLVGYGAAPIIGYGLALAVLRFSR